MAKLIGRAEELNLLVRALVDAGSMDCAVPANALGSGLRE